MYGKYQYGAFAFGDNPLTDVEITPYIPDLMKYLPRYYFKGRIMREIQDANAFEIGKVKYVLDESKKQLSIDTATYGLSYFEHELGIIPDASKPDFFRREIIKAKLRGRGTTTKKMIQNVAESFTNAEIKIIEYNNEFRFVIKFIGVKGIPPNMAGLKNEIEIIKPAHLLYSFEYTYTWWDSLNKLTWNNAKTMTWDELRIYEEEVIK